MEYKQREYPMFSACGLNGGLCPRHQMDGTSKCPGCSGKEFLTKHPTCRPSGLIYYTLKSVPRYGKGQKHGDKKISILESLLAHYDDGRRKGFFWLVDDETAKMLPHAP